MGLAIQLAVSLYFCWGRDLGPMRAARKGPFGRLQRWAGSTAPAETGGILSQTSRLRLRAILTNDMIEC